MDVTCCDRSVSADSGRRRREDRVSASVIVSIRRSFRLGSHERAIRHASQKTGIAERVEDDPADGRFEAAQPRGFRRLQFRAGNLEKRSFQSIDRVGDGVGFHVGTRREEQVVYLGAAQQWRVVQKRWRTWPVSFYCTPVGLGDDLWETFTLESGGYAATIFSRIKLSAVETIDSSAVPGFHPSIRCAFSLVAFRFFP